MEVLNPNDIEEIDNAHPLERFRRGIKTADTLRSYNSALKCVLCTALSNVLHGTYEERAAEFVEIGKKDPVKVRNIITQLVKAWKKYAMLDPLDPKHMSPGTIRVNLNPIKKLLDMNDVVPAWKMVYEMCPETNHGGPSPGWTREEIREMLSVTTSRMMRAIVLVLASSGVRRGGLELKWGDIDPVYLKDGEPVAGEDAPEMRGTAEPVCTMMRVYDDSSEKYITFMTPEAYKALMEYKTEWEDETGKAPGSEDPIFKKNGNKPIQMKCNSISYRLRTIAIKSGVRKLSDKKGKSYRVPISNGFRRGFNKTLMDVPSGGTLGVFQRKEYMLGHRGSRGVDHVYYYAKPMELATDYLRAVKKLTVTNEGLMTIERKEMGKTLLSVLKELTRIKRKTEARADMAVRQDVDMAVRQDADMAVLQDVDMTATQTDEKVDELTKIVKNIMERLDSQDEKQ